jgi:hypothetical protein
MKPGSKILIRQLFLIVFAAFLAVFFIFVSGLKSHASAAVTLSVNTSTVGKATFNWSDPGAQVGLFIWRGDDGTNGCKNVNQGIVGSRNPASSPYTWTHQSGSYMAALVNMSGLVSNCARFTVKTNLTAPVSGNTVTFNWDSTNLDNKYAGIFVWKSSGSTGSCSDSTTADWYQSPAGPGVSWSGGTLGTSYKARLLAYATDPYLSDCISFQLGTPSITLNADTTISNSVIFSWTPNTVAAPVLVIWNGNPNNCTDVNSGTVPGMPINPASQGQLWQGAAGSYSARLYNYLTGVSVCTPFTINATPTVILTPDTTSVPGSVKFSWTPNTVAAPVLVIWNGNPNNCTDVNSGTVPGMPINPASQGQLWQGAAGSYSARLYNYLTGVSNCAYFTINSASTVVLTADTSTTNQAKFTWSGSVTAPILLIWSGTNNCSDVNDGKVIKQYNPLNQGDVWTAPSPGPYAAQLFNYLTPVSQCNNFTVSGTINRTPITAEVSGSTVIFHWGGQQHEGVIVVWPYSTDSACTNASAETVHVSPRLPINTNSYPWSPAPDGTYRAAFVQVVAGDIMPVGCVSFTVGKIPEAGPGGLAGIFDPLAKSTLFPMSGKINTPADFISAVYKIILFVAGFILVIFIIISGLQIIFSQGDPKALSSARGRLTFAVVGFVIIFGAFVITIVVQKIFGLSIF